MMNSAPVPFQTKIVKFFENLRDKKLTGTRCVKCKTIYCPPRADCPKCMSSHVEWLKLSGKGKLLAFTTIYVGPETFEKYIPYVISIVELEEGPKLMSLMRDVKQEDINIGMSLEAVYFEGADGRITYGFTKPLEEKTFRKIKSKVCR